MFRSSSTGSRSLPGPLLVLVGVWTGLAVISQAGDTPPRSQPPGLHSTICTFDGQIRDDALATYLGNQILAHGGQVREVVIVTNTCYGGGLLEEVALIFHPSGVLPGVPWVFGSAAEWYQYGWAFRAEWCQDPNSNLGGKFTSALAGPHSGRWNPTPGAMRTAAAGNVQADLLTARQNDEAGPNHEQAESPVIAIGNGGENVVWSPAGAGHKVILFGGRMDQPAYTNDLENVQSALQSLYGAAPHHIQTIPDGTIQDLLDGITAACANLNADTQLLLYFTDHGGFAFDVVEHLQAQGQPPPHTVPQFKDMLIWLPPRPWPPWPGGPPPPPPPLEEEEEPLLSFRLLFPIDGRYWTICLNDIPIPLPRGPVVGEVEVPLAWESFLDGENHLTIQAVGEPSGPFVFDAMELSSGPVAMPTEPPPTAAVSTVLGYRFTAPWFPGSAAPFQIPPQVARPAWGQYGPLTHYDSDPRWPDRQGFWGVSGPQQTAILTTRLFHTDSPAEKQHVVIAADLRTNDPAANAWNVVVRPPSGDESTPSPAHRPLVVQATPNPDGSFTCIWEQDLTPVSRYEDLAFTLKTGASGDDYVFVDNVTITAVGRPKDKPLQDLHAPPEQQDRSQSHYFYFSSPEWPPAPHYEVLPTWYEGTSWECLGACPSEWLADAAGHHGVIGLPGGFPADTQLAVHFDGPAEPAGREHVSYQFDYYAGGGWLWWQPELPPGVVIENAREVVEELENGWRRVGLTFDATPPPAWQGFRWFLSATESSGPVVIDNLAMSSSPWWTDFWHDALDFHATGLGLHGQYGWKGWDNSPLADAFVTDVFARTPFNSLMVEGPADLVQAFNLPAGRYLLTAWQYVPADFQSGCDPTSQACGSYLVLLNTYEDGGPYHWSVQLHADSLTGSFIRDQQSPVSCPLITERWVRIDVLVDLAADLYRVYYDGVELGTAVSWTAGVYGGGGGELRIAALDLFANASSGVYYDDLHLRPVQPGDLTADGAISVEDLDLLVLVLLGLDADPYRVAAGDVNVSGTVDGLDIQAFVQLLPAP